MLPLILGAILSMTFLSACGDSDEPGGSGSSKGLYIQKSRCASESDFRELNDAIRNNELLSSYYYGGARHNHYASVAEFTSDDGSFIDYEAYLGRFRSFLGNKTQANALRFEGKSTVIIYYTSLCLDRGKNHPTFGEAIYTFYAGQYFGNMTYYSEPTYYTYIKYDDKLILNNGSILYKVSNGWRLDNDSAIFEKM